MLFSVIIPAYNCKKSIENTVNSLLNSGLFDFEIIIIDDGSTDGTYEVCDLLAGKHSNIHCIHQTNAGVSSARNVGIDSAKGDFLLFFDSDDTVDEYALKHAAEIIQEKEPDMLIFGISFDYYFNDRMYRRDNLVYPEEGMLSKGQWSAKFVQLYESNSISTSCTKFIRRELLNKNKVRYRKDLIEMEDFLFVVRCLEHCDDIYVLPEVIYRYRQTENERSTFNRLLRIPSLSDYMKPFEEEIEEFINRVPLDNKNLKDVKGIVNQIYTVLFYEQIRFGDKQEIESASKDMLNGKYSETIKFSNPELYQLLIGEKYHSVWLHSVKSRLRHWIAVRVKYIRSLWRS